MQLDNRQPSFSRQEVPHSDSDPGTPMSVLDTTKRRQVAALAKQFEKGVFTSDTSVKRASDVQEQGKRSFEYLKTLLQVHSRTAPPLPHVDLTGMGTMLGTS
jgi:hypothetical protein